MCRRPNFATELLGGRSVESGDPWHEKRLPSCILAADAISKLAQNVAWDCFAGEESLAWKRERSDLYGYTRHWILNH